MLLQEDVRGLARLSSSTTPLRRWSWRPGGTIASAAAEGALPIEPLIRLTLRRGPTVSAAAGRSLPSDPEVRSAPRARRVRGARPRAQPSGAARRGRGRGARLPSRPSASDALLLKGPALARALYTPTEHRGYSDVDLLVSPADLPRARQALSGVGFKHAEEVFGIDDVGGTLHSETWSRRGEGEWGGPLLIDLHWRLPGCEASADAIWRALALHRSSIELKRPSGRRPRPRRSRPAPRHPRRPAWARRPQGDRRPHPWPRALAAYGLALRRHRLRPSSRPHATSPPASGCFRSGPTSRMSSGCPPPMSSIGRSATAT